MVAMELRAEAVKDVEKTWLSHVGPPTEPILAKTKVCFMREISLNFLINFAFGLLAFDRAPRAPTMQSKLDKSEVSTQLGSFEKAWGGWLQKHRRPFWRS